jgi:hypothetical protein
VRKKEQKNNPNLLALFAFDERYFFIAGSVWGYLYIYHTFANLQNKILIPRSASHQERRVG